MGGRTSAKSKNDWIAKAYDRINLTMPKGKKEMIQACAEACGQSVNSFINAAIDAQMERSQGETPDISLFYGIKITMRHSGEHPPHFQAEYDTDSATISIREGAVLSGELPGGPLKLVQAWCELHRGELMQNWELSRQGKLLSPIAPLV